MSGFFTVSRVDRYVAAAALRSIALVAAALTTLFCLLKYVEELSFVGQGHYRLGDALSYVLLSAPYQLLQVAPVSVLLGCLLALAALGRNAELVALRSLGVSRGRVIVSLLKLSIPIIVGLFLLAQFVIPYSQQRGQVQRAAALASSAIVQDNGGFWIQGNGEYLNVQQFAYGTLPRNIEIYTFATDGSLLSYIAAAGAEIRPDGTWLLTNVVRKNVVSSQFQTEHFAVLPWVSFMSAQQMRLLMLPPENMPPVALYQYVRRLEHGDQQATRYRQELWAMASIPLSVVAMVLVAAAFSFGLPRTQSTGQQIMVGGLVGILFTLCQQIAGHLGLLLDLNPAVTELGPSLLLLVLAAQLLGRSHR